MANNLDSGYWGPEDLKRFLDQNGKRIVLFAVLLLVVVAGSRSYFQVEADEEAIILRLGVPTGHNYGPGLHFAIPFVDKVHKANVKKVHQLEFGFRTMRADVVSQFDENSYSGESLMLTGDLALVEVQWTVFYRIADLQGYLFNVRDVEATIRDISESSMRVLVGDRSSDEVMTLHRGEIAQKGKELIQGALDRCDSGIFVEKVALRQVEPPVAAQAAFNRVNEARALKQQMIEQAERARVEAVEKALGSRNAIVAEARGLKEQSVQGAKGEALRFLKFLEEYQKAPEITKQYLYLDAMATILPALRDKVILDSAGNGAEMLKILPLATPGSQRGGQK